MVKLESTYTDFYDGIKKLENLSNGIDSIDPIHKKLITEIVLLRAFYLLENNIKSIASKIVCGAKYIDGSSPKTIIRTKTINECHSKMKKYNRQKEKHFLRWTKGTDVKDNIRYLITPNDHFVLTIDNHSSFLDEIRRVRNRIAHNNDKTRKDYRIIVRRYYGAYLNGITPGVFLLSPRRTPCLINQYLSKSRVFIKTLVKA